MNQRTLAALALLAGCAAVALVVGPAGASHGHDTANVTVYPGSHDTGAQDVDYDLEAVLVDNFDRSPALEYPDRLVFQFEGATVDGCQAGTLESPNYELGVNQSTDSGYEYQAYEVDTVTWGGNAVEFTFDESDSDQQPRWGQGDRLELALNGCVANGDESDWYLAAIEAEGKSPTGRNVSFTELSHYYGICDGCESDADARETMGNPPSEPTPTPTPTPTETTTPTPTQNPYPTAEPTDTATETATPTATGTATQTAANGTEGADGPGGRDPTDVEIFGVSPLAIVAVVAVVSIGLAALGARRL